jgi:UDP-N-acetylmuramoyl-tripeptide--D-alanyl-D-alanine ligase
MQQRLQKLLRWQAKRYLRKNRPVVVVITGSVGKTSATQAIATVLAEKFAVRKTLKNYNTQLGVACSIFGSYLPYRLKNPFAWMALFVKHEFSLLRLDETEVLVLELGTDAPNDIAQFAWLQPSIAVVTAVAYEHMEFFDTLEAVAKEELAVAEFSEKTFINKEMVAEKYLPFAQTKELFNYRRSDISEHHGIETSQLHVVGEHSLDAVAAALAVGTSLELSDDELRQGAMRVRPQQGRMNPLKGIKNTTIIDDTYNSSPEAASAALRYLMQQKAPQRIALLGSMNELGAVSKEAHEKLGALCDPKKIDLVVTLGSEANNYTAKSAKKAGCKVLEATSPQHAAKIIRSELKDGALIVCKGSQNGVFAEEVVKLLLANPDDSTLLVRQDPFWLEKKKQYFRII